MTISDARVIDLIEHQTSHLERSELTDTEAQRIWDRFGNQVTVEPPSFKNEYRWQLTSRGWIGYLPISPALGLRLLPKVRLSNILRMFDYAYKLESFQFLSGVANADSLEEFYQELASVLSKRVLDRARKGLYSTYVQETDQLVFVRGSLLVRERVRRPWSVRLPCEYEEHTADIEENQILGWTLERISRSGLCTERILPTVRRAYRTLRGAASIQAHGPEDCIERLYTRLNEDYRPLHALCRFFLESTGPTHTHGVKETLPFVVDMARLFELFVAEWLKKNLPWEYELKYQEKVNIADDGSVFFQIDQVLRDRRTGDVIGVLDTKYKAPESPASEDVSQIMSYAESRGCTTGVLVYPGPLAKPLDKRIGRIRVKTLFFDLSHDLEKAGEAFQRDLLMSSHES